MINAAVRPQQRPEAETMRDNVAEERLRCCHWEYIHDQDKIAGAFWAEKRVEIGNID
jgi:hypothetical protein